ncbi:MAG: hypothetical protein SFX74_10475 [Fimbriimonadaceae bacterium]|nr:hypothetical protein [Fimbriimonadaceae bacterium]
MTPLITPWIALLALGVLFALPGAGLAQGFGAVALFGAVVAAIHHAEVIAHRVGEPFGTLILAVAITTIEVGLILSIMIAGGPEKAATARDTIYSALMIITTGVMGGCLFVGAQRFREQAYRVEGAMSVLAAIITLSVIALILPMLTTTVAGPVYSKSQLMFIALVSLALWTFFVRIQAGRHRDYFLPSTQPDDEDQHAEPPSDREAWHSFGLLLASLVAVIGLAKGLSPSLEGYLVANGAPKAVVGLVIALVVLLPETGAALQAARANRFQTSMNLALGSGLASIGLTIPAVAAASIGLNLPLTLGIGAKEATLLVMAFSVNAITLGIGRTNVLLAAVHLAIFATYLFLTFVP